MAKKKPRCKAGTHRVGSKCVSNKGSKKKCPTMKQLGKQWSNMTPAAKKKYPKRGSKSSWNNFVAEKRKGCNN